MEKVFVFRSNLAGRHGAEVALDARQYHGATYGQGVGRQGCSYAIPTKSRALATLPLPVIQRYVGDFLAHARARPTAVARTATPNSPTRRQVCSNEGVDSTLLTPCF